MVDNVWGSLAVKGHGFGLVYKHSATPSLQPIFD